MSSPKILSLIATQMRCLVIERMEFKNGENWICLFGPFCLDLFVRTRKDNESLSVQFAFLRLLICQPAELRDLTPGVISWERI